MSEQLTKSPLSPLPFLRGFSVPVDPFPVSRAAGFLDHLPADTATAASVLAGVSLTFTGDARAVVMTYSTGDQPRLRCPTFEQAFSVWVDDVGPVRVECPAGERQSVLLQLPERTADARVTVYLPEGVGFRPLGLEPVDGTIDADEPRPVLLAHGDSITQGWCASDPGLTWPALVGRDLQLDVCNLGFAGSARGELPTALQIANTPADVITIAWGTNCWSRIEMDGRYAGETMRLFLESVRLGHPATPILVLSPLARPEAEIRANRLGATMVELRQGIEKAVAELIERSGDTNMALLEGLDLVSTHHLAGDGVHPVDNGHAELAAAIRPALSRLLQAPR